MQIWDTLVSYLSSPLFIFSLVFWLVAFVLAKILGKKKENVTLFFPFIALFKTKIFNQWFKKVSRKHKKFWKIWWNIGVIVSFVFMAASLYFFISNFIQLIIDPRPENAILPLIPGVTVSLPMFSYLLLPILVTVTAHEFSHAIAAELDEIDVKSSGIFGGGIFFIIGFGAFVEVDEYQIYSNKVESGTRLRTYAAGVWTNIILAGIVFLCLNFYPQINGIGYKTQSFQVAEVIPQSEGGFNQGNVFTGDIVEYINGTKLDYTKGITLDAILGNETDLEINVGDILNLSCYDPSQNYNRYITLGHRAYVGFDYEQENQTALRVTNIHPLLNGGNNEGNIQENIIITKINNTEVSYNQNFTLDYFLTLKEPPYKVNLTSSNGTIYEININYYPKAPGAYIFDEIYLGIYPEKYNDTAIKIGEVFRNSTEYGINEGRIPEEVIITNINGIDINLENQSFPIFIKSEINPKNGDKLVFTDENGEEYILNVGNIPIIPVYIGIRSQTYWIPKNFIGRLIGGSFPNQVYTFLLYTWIVSFSLALFNLLPTAIFDGGRLTKELINKWIGTEIEPNAKKKLHYRYNPDEPQQDLMLHNITQILQVNELIPKQSNEDRGKKIDPDKFISSSLEFESIDKYNDGTIDAIKIKEDNIPRERIIEVEIEYNRDLKKDLKKKISQGISWGIGLILIGSFIISIIKFNNTFFWL